MKTTDSDVGKYLEMFTFLSKDRVSDIMKEHQVINSWVQDKAIEQRVNFNI
jgi:tyrosyl-tRNA synthetase